MQELMQVEKKAKVVKMPENTTWVTEAQERAKTQIAKIDSGMFAYVLKGKDKFNRQVSIKTITDLSTETKGNEIFEAITKGIAGISDKTERVFVKRAWLNKVRPYAKNKAVKPA